MEASLDRTMEEASAALARMDYLTCEACCLDALAMARELGAWSYYAAILLPLQESRRQRRMIAAEGSVRLGSRGMDGGPEDWLEQIEHGCIMLGPPHTPADADRLLSQVRAGRRNIEVLYASILEAGGCRLCSFAGPSVGCDVPSPPDPWLHRWMTPEEAPATGDRWPVPADWFLDACEALGDAALATVNAQPGQVDRVVQLEQCLQVVPDHEILHQRLHEAAMAVAGGSAGRP